MKSYKNYLLLAMPIISKIKTFYYRDDSRVDWFLFYDFVNRKGENIGVLKTWAIYFYTVPINFIILSYCMLFPKGIQLWVKQFIFTLCCLDLLHMALYAGKSFVFFKLMICIIITLALAYKRGKGWR